MKFVSGAGATGVFVTANGTGAIGGASTINSTGQINTTGANATRVLVNGGAGAVAVNNTGLVSATGANSAGIGLRVQRLQGTSLSDANADRGSLHSNRTGVIGGIDYTAGNLRFGGFASTTDRWGDYGGKVALGFRF